MPHKRSRAALYTSKNDEWYTPDDLTAALAAFFGGAFDLDPCADPGRHVPARRHIVGLEGGDGLAIPWTNLTIFVNPPFSAIPLWVAKFLYEPVREGAFLVPARVDTRWMQRTGLRDLPTLNIEGRLKFTGSSTNSATFPSIIAYRGPRVTEFVDAFDPAWGYVSQRLRAFEHPKENVIRQSFLCLSA